MVLISAWKVFHPSKLTFFHKCKLALVFILKVGKLKVARLKALTILTVFKESIFSLADLLFLISLPQLPLPSTHLVRALQTCYFLALETKKQII